MARRPSAQQECSPEGRPWGRACVLQGKGFPDCRAASHGLGPPGHSPAGELREYGCVGSLNSNWARFSLHWQKQNWRSAYPTHTHQTVLLRLGPAASTLPRAGPLPTISPNPPHSSQAAFCLSLSLPSSLFLLLSVSFYYSFCLSLLLTLCFCLCFSLSPSGQCHPRPTKPSSKVLAGLGWTVGHTLDPQADRPQFCSCHRAEFPEASQACKCPYPAPKSLPPAFWEPLLTVLRSCALTSLPRPHSRRQSPSQGTPLHVFLLNILFVILR